MRSAGRRGGLTAEIHLLAGGQGQPLVLLLTAGNVNDTTMFAPLLDAPQVARPGPGGRGPGRTTCWPTRATARGPTGSCCAAATSTTPSPNPGPAGQPPPPRQRGRAPGRVRKTRYRRRNVVERGFCQLKHWRGLATRYDRHARNYLGGLTLAALLLDYMIQQTLPSGTGPSNRRTPSSTVRSVGRPTVTDALQRDRGGTRERSPGPSERRDHDHVHHYRD
jgi:transposase